MSFLTLVRGIQEARRSCLLLRRLLLLLLLQQPPPPLLLLPPPPCTLRPAARGCVWLHIPAPSPGHSASRNPIAARGGSQESQGPQTAGGPPSPSPAHLSPATPQPRLGGGDGGRGGETPFHELGAGLAPPPPPSQARSSSFSCSSDRSGPMLRPADFAPSTSEKPGESFTRKEG